MSSKAPPAIRAASLAAAKGGVLDVHQVTNANTIVQLGMYSGLIRDWPKRVCFGPGSIAQLPRLMGDLGARRAMVACGRTVAGGEMLAKIRAVLGERLAGVFDAVPAHTPFECVQQATARFKSLGADTVVSVGGGSAIDCGKGIALLFATRGAFEPYVIDYAGKGMQRASMSEPGLVHIAVPTTAGSASDVMPTAAIRDTRAGRKMLFWDERMVPDATVLDPEMAVYAGPQLSAATGMTAMARAMECLYSAHRHPISTALALHSARLLRKALPRSIAAPGDLEARADCQMAATMSGTASINAMVSVVHAIGHVVGGRYGLQHGISHSILLAPAMRRMLPAIGEDQFQALEAMGGAREGLGPDAAGARAAELLQAMVDKLPLPRRLRELGMTQADIPATAAAAMGDYMMANAPRAIAQAEIEGLLHDAF
jgi:alcohol dehydrogenase class IV